VRRYLVVMETRGDQVGRLHVLPDATPEATICGLPVEDDGQRPERAISEPPGGGRVSWAGAGYRCIRCATRYGEQRGRLEA
jgi:hypothetical protein